MARILSSVLLDRNVRYGAPSTNIMTRLDKARFVALWTRSLRPGVKDNAAAVFDQLDSGYGDESRAYHTRRHITHCLNRFDMAAHMIADADAVELAIWFHDVIYEPGAGDNELRSAELFRDLAADKFDQERIDKVFQLVLDTVHRHAPKSLEGRYLADIDLSSFGLPWHEFRADSDAVREEFPHIPDAEFFKGQIGFLEGLLARPFFYYTIFFRHRYEQTARSNVRRYLNELRRLGYG